MCRVCVWEGRREGRREKLSRRQEDDGRILDRVNDRDRADETRGEWATTNPSAQASISTHARTRIAPPFIPFPSPMLLFDYSLCVSLSLVRTGTPQCHSIDTRVALPGPNSSSLSPGSHSRSRAHWYWHGRSSGRGAPCWCGSGAGFWL